MSKIKHAFIEAACSIITKSDGDLWPCAWADDGALYTANGDGKGFDLSAEWCDIVVNKVEGDVNHLRGERLSGPAGIGGVFTDEMKYNRKPTGMAAAEGKLFLAVQNLNKETGYGGFDDVPCASICVSHDKGKSWKYDSFKPMFDNYQFTTVIFLDYGQNNNNSDGYMYAYGLDNNWRASFCKKVEDPTKLYLARVQPDHVLDISRWEFFSGLNKNNNPEYSNHLQDRVPVLEDTRKVLVTPPPGKNAAENYMSVISQGSIVYNKPLDCYIYSSWTENTFEFYQSSKPWGPFTLFLSYNFGFYPWTDNHYGGYATVIPSKFISQDGRTMYVVSSTFAGGIRKYNFNLRKLEVTL
jgi:hypothetical protein